MAGKFNHAIVRIPCEEMINGITSSALGKPDYKLALQQHKKYIEVLSSLGLDVRILESDSRFPDSVFVEDVALCTSEFAVICSPGAKTRKGEEEDMNRVLNEYFNQIESINFPGSLEAGDVMMAGRHFYIGISDRTNMEGADQLIEFLTKYGFSGEKIELENLLHLKTGVSYLENNTILAVEEFIHHGSFKKFRKIEVPGEEAYAANSLWINDFVLVPSGFPETRKRIERSGYKTIAVEVSEFEKLDGGLSCLSLRF